MITSGQRAARMRVLFFRFCSWCCGFSFCFGVYADQIELKNGDRYFGKVLSMNSNTVVLESPVLGQVQLSRSQVVSISLNGIASASLPVTNTTPNAAVSAGKGGAANGLDTAVRRLAANTNAVQQVHRDMLANAGPEATQKFNEMLSDLLTGKLTIAGLRKEADSAAKQLRELRKDLGEDSGGMVDGYLEILDKFLRDPEVQNSAATPPPAASSPKTSQRSAPIKTPESTEK
jgi:hypothetical protein